MDRHLMDQADEPLAETPEDVAILYSWANLHGAKYRDFSASRREYRAQVRHRAAEQLRMAELNAQAQAEASAANAEQRAREAERTARTSEQFERPFDRERALREAEEAARRASAERMEAARRAESAASAQALARREEREIAEAHASAERQAARWHESEVRRRRIAEPRPSRVPSQAGDPYELTPAFSAEGSAHSPQESREYNLPSDERPDSARVSSACLDSARLDPDAAAAKQPIERRTYREDNEVKRPRGFRPDVPSGMRSAYRLAAAEAPLSGRNILRNDSRMRSATPPYTPFNASTVRDRQSLAEDLELEQPGWQSAQEASAPAWLYGNTNPNSQQSSARPIAGGGAIGPGSAPAGAPSVDSLQSSRERVASRWFALKGVFDPESANGSQSRSKQDEVRTPVLAVFSLAGGVGKTSMVATLGRALSSLGEKVLLADTTSHGLLPYYFGATELKPGVVRTFSPPSGSMDAPIHLVSYNVDQQRTQPAQDALSVELAKNAGGVQRMVVDFNAISGWLMRGLSRLDETVLVPLAPDMNSVISLQMIERYFDGVVDAAGRRLRPFYVLNQFDASLPLHLDVREVLRRQLGERLLPYVVRRSQAVSEALAEGMTVVDYQPEGLVAEDYLNIAKWLRSVSAPVTSDPRTVRWSER